MAIGNFGVVPKRLTRKLKRAQDDLSSELLRKLGDRHHQEKHLKRKSLQHQHSNKEFGSTQHHHRQHQHQHLHQHENDDNDNEDVDNGEVTVGGKK